MSAKFRLRLNTGEQATTRDWIPAGPRTCPLVRRRAIKRLKSRYRRLIGPAMAGLDFVEWARPTRLRLLATAR